MGDELGLLRLLRELNRSDRKQHLQRVTGKVDPGHFAVTFKNTKTKENIERPWVSKVAEGHLSYWIKGENLNKEYTIKLDNLPEEVPTRAMRRRPTSANMLST